ncbi:DUF3857 domain-containing protein [Mucilaginibacter paludis]|uniref:Transglutaminase domain-containing protein n=1 Tax=Mucilaginibacter paludis DSM 18603 TaxID=714943 RepID=H1YIP8_9SPHI|nr:DUF3857 domain-containing protein [Mucilaginibacter paludis]EHQ27593.1 transglutaminase domain-containing protein [Mucilaginibacter paludis DSM 18603]
MKKISTLVLFLVCLCYFHRLHAQTQAFGKIDVADLELKNCDFEKDANAMVLFDKGDVYFDQNFSIVMERHKRIKIFNDKGKDEANIRIPFFGGNRLESITDIQVETINEVNGKPEITKLEKKLIYTENLDKVHTAIVFAFPNVKPGSVIEFKYRWQTDYVWNFPDWIFQDNIPTRYSELSTQVPDIFFYKTQTRTAAAYVKHTSSSDSKSIGSGQDVVSYSVDNQVRGIANIPSLQDEPYMRSRADNLQGLYFQLTSIRPIGGFVRNYNETWDKIGNTVCEDEDFGSQFKRKLKDEELIIAKAKTLKTDDEKIAYVFNAVKNRMKWNDVDRWYTNDGTSKAWEKQSGNSTEINLVLYHLLKQAGLKAYPMMVSTRDNGRVNPYYPNLNQFNRAVAYIPVDSTKRYILDASNRYNVYNEVPDELLNSYGFQINKDDKQYGMLFIDKTQPARKSVFLQANILADGKMEGTAEINNFSYQKLSTVEKYKRDGEDKYKTFLKDNDNNLSISSLKFENMDVDSLPLSQKIDFKLTLTGSDGDYIYFNPNMFLSMRSNPFLSEKRASDIDFGYRSLYSVNGNYKIPAGYKTEGLPKNTTLMMPDQSISFRRLVGEEDGLIQISYMISFKKSIFFKENYAELREFYKKMYEMLNEQIVLKKS